MSSRNLSRDLCRLSSTFLILISAAMLPPSASAETTETRTASHETTAASTATPASGASTATATTTPTPAKTPSPSSDEITTASTPALHVGRLTPADEPAAIARSMDALTTVPGTDLLLGYRFSTPEGWYQLERSSLVWHEPSPSDTHQLAVTVQDAADLRVLPGAKVEIGFTRPEPDAKAVGTTQTLHFLWDADFYQYAINVALPEDAKTLDLHVRVEPPSFRRHDQTLGAFFAQPVTHTFRSVTIPAPVKPEPKPGVPTTRGLFSEGRRPFAEPTPYPGAAQNPPTTGTQTK